MSSSPTNIRRTILRLLPLNAHVRHLPRYNSHKNANMALAPYSPDLATLLASFIYLILRFVSTRIFKLPYSLP